MFIAFWPRIDMRIAGWYLEMPDGRHQRRTSRESFGDASEMTILCQSCRSRTETELIEPIAARCSACGKPLSQPVAEIANGEARVFNGDSGDLGIPLDDGSTACPVAFGPYRVIGLIGKGGMGLVYHARHDSTGLDVAVKTVRVRKRGMLHRIRREIHALARIQHPGLVRIIETGQAEGLPWYAMELIQGPSLQERLHSNSGKQPAEIQRPAPLEEKETRADFILALSRELNPSEVGFLSGGTTATIGLDPTSGVDELITFDDLPTGLKGTTLGDLGVPTEDQAGIHSDPKERIADRAASNDSRELDQDRRDFLGIIAQLCDALSYLHAEGIVHRDIKPQNVKLRNDGSPVLLDFGLASYFCAGGRESLEVAGRVEGTPEYMSPEQIRGEYVDARSDLYAVGCILYEGLTGKVPFRAPTPGGVLRGHVRSVPAPPRDFRSEIPESLDALILRLLAKKASDRPGYASDILAALESLGCGSKTRADDRPTRDYLYRPGFVGRVTALSALEKHVRRVITRPGHCIFLRGQSGVGKTRFSMESARQFEQNGMTVVTAECLPIGVDSDDGPAIRATPLHPFRPFLQMVTDYCLEKGGEATEKLFGPDGGILAECEPLVKGLPGLCEATPCSHGDEEGSLQSRLIEALGRTLEQYATISPVVLFIDDLEWADALTLHFLALFHVGVWDSPNVAVIASFRSEEADTAIREYLPVFQDATFVDLGPLEEPSLGAIVRDMLGSNQADDRFVLHLTRRSNGNPFFVAEYLRAAVSEGLLARDETGCWRPTMDQSNLDSRTLDAAIPLPESVQDLVIRRLSGLSEATRKILELASTVGRQVDAEILESVGLLDERSTLKAVEDLRVAQILEESRDGVYRFTHDMLREISYGQIPGARRRALHRAVALAIELRNESDEQKSRCAATLAHHWYRSIGDRRNEPEAVDRAIHYLQRSIRQALQAGLPAEAVDFGRAAARLLGVVLPDSPDKIREALDEQLTRIESLLDGQSIASLADRPPSNDPLVDRTVELLVSIQPPAFLSNQLDLFALMACRNLAATLETGPGPLAPSVFALYGMVERIFLDDSHIARAYGTLAKDLDRASGGTQMADVIFLKSWFIDHWLVPLEEILGDCDRGAIQGIETGEILYGSYNHGAYVHFLAASGAPLGQVIAEADARLAIVGRRVIMARFHCLLERQLASALAALTCSPTDLGDDRFDESRDLAFICRTTNSNQVGFYHVARMKLHYYQGEYAEALRAARRAEAASGSFACQPAEVDLTFFRALSLLALANEDRDHLEEARADHNRLLRWEAGSESNFAHKTWLVEAEIARVEGRHQEASELYEKAIESARFHGFSHHSALGSERYARFRIELDQPADEIVEQAIAGYREWGAMTLVVRAVKLSFGNSRQSSPPEAVEEGLEGNSTGGSKVREDRLE